MFIDRCHLFIKSGDGGAGCISFRREKYIPNGGPNGGDGGQGGNIYIQADRKLNTLFHFRYKKHYHARNGFPGEGSNCTGKSGEDLILKVPCGTLINLVKGQDNYSFDLLIDQEKILILKGGQGGKGNAHFKNSINQAPRKSQTGTIGEEAEAFMELKILADIGLVGLPNAGKSTLLAGLTTAKPKIADYPFTTLEPNLGVLEHSYGFITIADIPGLIEGAHEGHGLGDNFLKHIERTTLLLHVIDVSLSDFKKNIKLIEQELGLYNIDLLKKERLLIFNKIDQLTEKDLITLQKKFPKAFFISAATRLGLDKLTEHLVSSLQLAVKDFPASA